MRWKYVLSLILSLNSFAEAGTCVLQLGQYTIEQKMSSANPVSLKGPVLNTLFVTDNKSKFMNDITSGKELEKQSETAEDCFESAIALAKTKEAYQYIVWTFDRAEKGIVDSSTTIDTFKTGDTCSNAWGHDFEVCSVFLTNADGVAIEFSGNSTRAKQYPKFVTGESVEEFIDKCQMYAEKILASNSKDVVGRYFVTTTPNEVIAVHSQSKATSTLVD